MRRSDELQKWLVERQTAENIVKDVPSMPEKLKKELLEEALRLDRIRAVFEAQAAENAIPEKMRVELAIQSYAKTPGILPHPPLSLSGWKEDNSPIANIVSNSSLFAVRPSTKFEPKRRVLHNEKILSRQGTEIEYSGEQLFQGDEDVLLILKEISREGLGKIYEVSASSILKRMNNSTGGKSYTDLADTLYRLQWTSVRIRYNPTTGNNQFKIGTMRKNRRIGFNLVTYYDIDLETKQIRFSLNQALVLLYGNNEYGMVDLKKRFRLGRNELAKMLQGIFASQMTNRQFHRVDKIREWSGLSSEMKEFTRKLKKALDELIRTGVIKAYWISKPPKGKSEEKRLCIWKDYFPSKTEPVPEENGYFQQTDPNVLDREEFPEDNDFDALPLAEQVEDVLPLD